MTWDIPNYDSIVGRAALPDPDPHPTSSSRARPPQPPSEDDWDPNKVELDLIELEKCLSSRQ